MIKYKKSRKGDWEMKKFFLILGVVFTAVLLAGCGSSGTTTATGEVVGVETRADLAERGVQVDYDYALYISIEDEEGTIHKIHLWEYSDLEGKSLALGSVIKVRYLNNWTIDGGKRVYDEDGLYLRTYVAEKWHWVEAFVVLEVPAVEVQEPTRLRDMEVGTYGYLPMVHMRYLGGTCIWKEALVRPLYGSGLLRGIDFFEVMLRVERQPDGFHISVVALSEMGINDTGPINLQPCS